MAEEHPDHPHGLALPHSHGGFTKMDFHIHTPISQCYEDNMSPELHLNTQPEDIVKAAIAVGLRVMVISDHNAVANIDPIRRVAQEMGLVILPGIEITAEGGHMLALFETDTPVERMTRLLDQLEFPEKERGNGSYATHFWLDQCADRVEAFGGFVIAAHIDREPRGFIAGYFDREIKQRIHGSDYLGGLEITDPRSKLQWEQGAMRHYTKPYPVVQGSDAHAPGEVGRRPTFVYLQELTLKGLRKAFEEYQDFVKFPSELDRELGR